MNIKEKCIEMIINSFNNKNTSCDYYNNNKIYELHREIVFEEIKKNERSPYKILNIVRKYRKKGSILNFMNDKDKVINLLIPVTAISFIIFLILFCFMKLSFKSGFNTLIVLSIFPFIVIKITNYLKIKYKKLINIEVEKINSKEILNNIIMNNILMIDELEKMAINLENNKYYEEITLVKNFIIDKTFNLKSKSNSNKDIFVKKIIESALLDLTCENTKEHLKDSNNLKLIENKSIIQKMILDKNNDYKIELTIKDKLESLKK